jgi:hypothetical protein
LHGNGTLKVRVAEICLFTLASGLVEQGSLDIPSGEFSEILWLFSMLLVKSVLFYEKYVDDKNFVRGLGQGLTPIYIGW